MRNSRSRSAAKTARRATPQPQYAFGFLDETGTLGSPRDPVFAVGLMRTRDPYQLQRPIQRIRDKQHFYDEIKWSQVSAKKLPLLETLVDVFFSSPATLSVFVIDKKKHDPVARFGGLFEAYECLARQLLIGSMKRGETLFLIADEFSTPPAQTFEENVRDYVNNHFHRKAVAGVCRMRSSGVDLLQMIDLMLGAVVYEHKIKAGAAGPGKGYNPKVKLLDYIKEKAGVKSFVGGYRDGRINVATYHN